MRFISILPLFIFVLGTSLMAGSHDGDTLVNKQIQKVDGAIREENERSSLLLTPTHTGRLAPATEENRPALRDSEPFVMQIDDSRSDDSKATQWVDPAAAAIEHVYQEQQIQRTREQYYQAVGEEVARKLKAAGYKTHRNIAEELRAKAAAQDRAY